jgi:hypothetical protein
MRTQMLASESRGLYRYNPERLIRKVDLAGAKTSRSQVIGPRVRAPREV